MNSYKVRKYFKYFLILIIFFLGSFSANAHQPRINESIETVVTDPEISKAYYGELAGEPHEYLINSDKEFELYVNVLVPDIKGQKKDVSAVVLKEGKELAVLEGINFEWTKFYEPFGADTYWKGPEYKSRAEAGAYKIIVWSSNNDSKYSLAIGEIEAFDGTEGMNALTVIPKLKKDFFGGSSVGFIKSPFGWGLVVLMYIAAFVFGFLYRLVLRKFSAGTVRGVNKNIGSKDRIIRLLIAIGLFLWAITTTWSPVLLFFSGFALFESLFSWCGFYAAIGRNTCPL